MADLVTVAVVVLCFGSYGLVVLARHARLQRAAAALQASYAGRGLTRLGAIEGTGFTVRVVQVRRSFYTRVEVAARRTPGVYFLDARFFRTPFDWSRARVPGRRTERVFCWSLSLPGYAQPNEEQRAFLSTWLNRTGANPLRAEALEAARIDSVAIDDDGVSTSFDGIVTDPARLRRAVDLLQRLAA